MDILKCEVLWSENSTHRGTILGTAGNTEIRLIIFIKESVINEVTLYSKEILPTMQYVVLQLYKYSKSASISCNTILQRCLLWQILFNLAKLYGSLLYYPKKKINAPLSNAFINRKPLKVVSMIDLFPMKVLSTTIHIVLAFIILLLLLSTLFCSLSIQGQNRRIGQLRAMFYK